MSRTVPLVSVVVVNANGRRWLPGCLDALSKQTHRRLEIILVDHGSTDDSLAFVRRRYPDVKLISRRVNSGFASGNNAGVAEARGKYVLLLNNDTVAAPDCVAQLLQAFQSIPRLGSVQAKLVHLDNPDRLDVCGAYWTDSSLLYYYGYGKPADDPAYNRAQPFFSNKAAGMLVPKDLIDRFQLFDEDFWCYYEETDFCHRLWLYGYECWYWPPAVVRHFIGGTSRNTRPATIQFHNFKNKLCSFLKNFQVRTLLRVVPMFLAANFVLSLVWLGMGKPRQAAALYRALWWNLRHLPSTLAKRRTVQAARRRSDRELFRLVKRNPRLVYYYYLLRGLERYVD